MLKPIMLNPTYRDYVWGGRRLRTGGDITAEAWVVYEKNLVKSGLYSGRTLEEVAAIEGETLLGTNAIQKTGRRFPLLIKLLDCARWLSLQVHPSDEQAQRLEGPGHFGKTEAWYIIDADENAQLISGFLDGVTHRQIQNAAGNKEIINLVARHKVMSGDYLLIRPGTIHALGPGLLIFEVQQTSDITYRVYDWDRPQTDERKLHIEQAIEVLDPESRGEIYHLKNRGNEKGKDNLVACKYFSLDLARGPSGSVYLNTEGKTFFVITVLQGLASIQGDNWSLSLEKYETVLIPSVCGHFSIQSPNEFQALIASVP